MDRRTADIYSVFVGTTFRTSERGLTYIYRVIGFDPNRTGREFALMELETETFLDVSESWFHQRKIKIL